MWRSPCRTVVLVASRCSRSACAYLREVPRASRSSGSVISPLSCASSTARARSSSTAPRDQRRLEAKLSQPVAESDYSRRNGPRPVVDLDAAAIGVAAGRELHVQAVGRLESGPRRGHRVSSRDVARRDAAEVERHALAGAARLGIAIVDLNAAYAGADSAGKDLDRRAGRHGPAPERAGDDGPDAPQAEG